MKWRRRVFGFGRIPGIAVLWVMLLLSPLFAAPSVQVEWRVIDASHKKGVVDPRLKDIYRNLGAVFKYGAYRLIAMDRVSLAPNQQVSVPLSKNETFVIRITGIGSRWVHARIRLLKEGQSIFDTSVQMMKGRTLLIGGPSKRGKALIFSLRSFW